MCAVLEISLDLVYVHFFFRDVVKIIFTARTWNLVGIVACIQGVNEDSLIRSCMGGQLGNMRHSSCGLKVS